MSQMFPSNYLGKDDVLSPIRTTVIKVTQDELKTDMGTETKTVLHFAHVEKGFICNKTNAFTLVDAYGDESDLWVGKPVEIYVDPAVSFGGKRVGGLRLRIPTGNAAAPSLTWTQALADCAAVGISKDELVAFLKSKGHAEYRAARDAESVRELIATKAEASFGDDQTGDAFE